MRSPYGGARLDLGRMPVTRRHTYGLRSESSVDGWYAGPRNPRKRRETVDPVTNLIGPADDDDTPVRRGGTAPRVDYDSERHAAGVIRMADF